MCGSIEACMNGRFCWDKPQAHWTLYMCKKFYCMTFSSVHVDMKRRDQWLVSVQCVSAIKHGRCTWVYVYVPTSKWSILLLIPKSSSAHQFIHHSWALSMYFSYIALFSAAHTFYSFIISFIQSSTTLLSVLCPSSRTLHLVQTQLLYYMHIVSLWNLLQIILMRALDEIPPRYELSYWYCINCCCMIILCVLYLQAFKPLVGKSLLSQVIAVEFLLDRQLDFLSDHSAYQPYQVKYLWVVSDYGCLLGPNMSFL